MDILIATRAFVERVVRYSATVGMIFIIPLMLITAGDVLGRGVVSKPIAGTFELSEYMLAIIILLGTAYTQQVKGHVAVDFLTTHFGKKTQLVCQVITLFLSLFIVTILVWQGLKLGIEETGVTDQLRIPKAPFKILTGIGGILLWLQILFDMIDAIVKLKRREA
jgi:TRAP-type C4-dicarboxylate transport system permease small subunit